MKLITNDKTIITKIPPEVSRIINTLVKANYQCYIIGGASRAILTSMAVSDYDLTTSASFSQLERLFPFGSVLSRNKQEWMFRIDCEDYNIDITPMRSEADYSHRVPQAITYTDQLLIDVQRRDFTINSIALTITGEIIDYYHGVDDLKAGVVKMIGDPKLRLVEDPLRILRAIRLLSEQEFNLDESLCKAIIAKMSLLNEVNSGLTRTELLRIFSGPSFNDIVDIYHPLFEALFAQTFVSYKIENGILKDIKLLLIYLVVFLEIDVTSPIYRLLNCEGKIDKVFKTAKVYNMLNNDISVAIFREVYQQYHQEVNNIVDNYHYFTDISVIAKLLTQVKSK